MNIKNYISLFKQNKTVFALMIWLAIVPLTTSSLLTLFLLQNEGMIESFQISHWIAFLFTTIFTMAFAFTPTTFVALVSGYFLGWSGSIFVIISYQIASLIGYYISRYLNKNLIYELVKQHDSAERVFENVNKNQFMVVILSRLSPALPFALMNVVLAVSNIRIRNFFFGGLIGMLPRTLLFIWIGSQANYLRNALEQNEGIAWLVSATLLVFAIFYLVLRPSRRSTH